ncbi:histone-lysine N-methyltransferase SETMAR [Trichonephila clavipes]|nr:histone-lysine N-methyltransferase SETMAR [Trichonephila clavipes]
MDIHPGAQLRQEKTTQKFGDYLDLVRAAVLAKIYRDISVRHFEESYELWNEELLSHDQTLNSKLYCHQLDRLKLGIDQKRPELANRRGVVFHHDNARPHTFVVTHQNLWELSRGVLMHPPYSPDLAPSDYHLFLALQNFLSDKKLGSREDCKNRFLDVFSNKSQDFYERGIMKLILKWQ